MQTISLLFLTVDHHHLQALWGLHRPEGLPSRHRQPPCCLWWRNGEQRRPHPHLLRCWRCGREGPGSVDLWTQSWAPRRAACWLHWCDCNHSPARALPDIGRADPRGAGSGLRWHPGPAALPERLPQQRAHRPGRTPPFAAFSTCTRPAATAAAPAQLRLTDASIPPWCHTCFCHGRGKGALQRAAGSPGHLLPLLCVWSPDYWRC